MRLASLIGAWKAWRQRPPAAADALRIAYVANALLPTLQLSFLKPLKPLVEDGSAAGLILTEEALKRIFGKHVRGRAAWRYWKSQLDAFAPHVVVCCRYSGPHAEALAEYARRRRIPLIYHIDDDLLHVPRILGERKFAFHNSPERTGAVSHLMRQANLVYCSTAPLRERLASFGLTDRLWNGALYCSSAVAAPPPPADAPPVFGYMGFDHAHDFEQVLPAVIAVLERFADARFELFGSIPLPAALERFGERVRTLPPVPDYEAFLESLAGLRWLVGICPLADTDFNQVKADTKWVEYTAAGMAVAATERTIYDRCCAGGAGVLLPNDPAAWADAIGRLLSDPATRLAQVERAQRKLEAEYSPAHLRRQVLEAFARAGVTHLPGQAAAAAA